MGIVFEFYPKTTRVARRVSDSEVILTTYVMKWSGEEWTEVNFEGDAYRSHICDVLSCRGVYTVCGDCAVFWTRRMYRDLRGQGGPVWASVRLLRGTVKVPKHDTGGADGQHDSLFHIFPDNSSASSACEVSLSPPSRVARRPNWSPRGR